MADLFGAHFIGTPGEERAAAAQTLHTYLRLSPELRANVYGPEVGDEPHPYGKRHPVLRGFEETDILPYGGTLIPLKLDGDVILPLTYVPPFPIYPPETAWMRQPKTDIPGLVIKARVAFLPADVDRRYARERLPDYADLLANIVRWAVNDEIPLRVDGHGSFDCNLYTQPGRVIAHVANLTGTAGMPIDDLVPSGPLKFQLRLPPDVRAQQVKFLVANTTAALAISSNWATVNIPSVTGHEVLLFE